MKTIWTEMTGKAFSSHLAEESLLPGSVNASAIVGGYAAALGVKAACRTYVNEGWEVVDPGMQVRFRDAHEELELLRLSLAGKAEEEQEGNDAVRALAIPLTVAEQCLSVLEQLQDVVTCGGRDTLTDVGTASSLALAALDGALLNVRNRMVAIPDSKQRADWMEQAERMWERGSEIKEETLAALFIRMSV